MNVDAVTVDVGGTMLELVRGDITAQPDIAAVVNAANAQLRPGGGVAGALHAKAGPALARECARLAPIAPGDAVITGAHSLPNDWVIHCLAPRHGVDRPEDELLAACYRNALDLASAHDIASIAFPSLGTGAFGYPLQEAAAVALTTVLAALPRPGLQCVRFVLFSPPDLAAYRDALERLR